MSAPGEPTPFSVEREGARLRGEAAGSGPAVLLLHGATATRRYVLHGSRALERAGHRVIAFDARGHGASTGPRDPAGYSYGAFAHDALAVLDALGIARATLVGHSLGAAVAARLALTHPERVEALAVVSPAHRGRPADAAGLERWRALAGGLEEGGVAGFLAAYGEPRVPAGQRDTMRKVITQRLERHDDLEALAACLRGVFRGAAFDGIAALADVTAPALVVASRDEMDPDHPETVARAWADAIPGAELVVEAEGESPLAWRGGSLSAAIAEFLSRRI